MQFLACQRTQVSAQVRTGPMWEQTVGQSDDSCLWLPRASVPLDGRSASSWLTRAPTREPSQSKRLEFWPNIVVVLASGWLPAGGCRSVWAWCSWRSLLGRFLCLLFVPFFFFSGDVTRNGHFRLVTAGVTFLLPDGRDVGSRQGHRPKNR